MNLKYAYPAYEVDLTGEMLEQCCDIAIRLLKEVGMVVRHEKFLKAIKGKEGIKVEGERVYFEEVLIRRNMERFIAQGYSSNNASHRLQKNML